MAIRKPTELSPVWQQVFREGRPPHTDTTSTILKHPFAVWQNEASEAGRTAPPRCLYTCPGSDDFAGVTSERPALSPRARPEALICITS